MMITKQADDAFVGLLLSGQHAAGNNPNFKRATARLKTRLRQLSALSSYGTPAR
ncbi:MAG: hypothetical protein H8E90_09315 [Anaerolineales bacterium]|nr:hypothetical protein [Anaerolineales bacterium]